ncbi:hypothetical protein BISU_1650 [Bifidobacterium subtile]|jgi:hypothetical protein|uniref:Uncharacterized protein n=1 Tax=Bifidobacterium subtile TaxID=77635 RepID=A0A087E3V0_9BIFI|nr:hypothetical protein BISU_1650 [Bifidobacterium subtile]
MNDTDEKHMHSRHCPFRPGEASNGGVATIPAIATARAAAITAMQPETVLAESINCRQNDAKEQ